MIENTEYAGMPKHRLSRGQKEKNGKQWYKNYLDYLDSVSFTNDNASNNLIGRAKNNVVSEYKRMKVNYDLFNNIIDTKDFEYVINPFGSSEGELPANFVNRDIISPKIKVLLGMEMKRPFSWKVIATNEEATTRREQKEFEMMRDFVKQQILTPIRQEIEMQKMQEAQGQELNDQQKQQIQQQIEQELAAKTPEEVRRYMLREHQDPAEALAHQILEYLVKKEDIAKKFNKGFKHMCISAKQIYHVGIINGHPILNEVNPLYFDYDKSPDEDFIEKGEWAVNEYRLSPSTVVSWFSKELTQAEIDEIYTTVSDSNSLTASDDWTFSNVKEDDGWTVRVLHGVWKALRKIGFLKYLDETGTLQERMVDESYTLNKDLGDVSISWEWVTRWYEGYKIGRNIYKGMGEGEGQPTDLDDLYDCNLPYYGTIMDSMNSLPTSPVDRLKAYQYYYNIVMYRIELLMASDKGKILMMNIGMIPESAGIDVEKFLYFAESSKIGFLNPNEEGNRGDYSIPNAVKEIDMSLASDIQKYINFAEYLERRAGLSVGVPPEAEGQIGPNAAVTNTKQVMMQSSHVLEPIFDLHNHVKKNVLQALIDTAKIAYGLSKDKHKKLSYVLDDMSLKMLDIDTDLLNNSTYGIFVSNSTKAHETKEVITQLAHAAMQSQKIELSDIIKVLRSDGVQEAEELLTASEKKKREEMQQMQTNQIKEQQKLEEQKAKARKEEMAFDRETKLLVQQEKNKGILQSQTVETLGFNEDKDYDKDGKLDVLEVAKQGVDVDIKQRKQLLAEKKFEHDKKMDEKQLKQDNKNKES